MNGFYSKTGSASDCLAITNKKYLVQIFNNTVFIYRRDYIMINEIVLKTNSIHINYFIKEIKDIDYISSFINFEMNDNQIKYFEEQVEKLLKLKAFI